MQHFCLGIFLLTCFAFVGTAQELGEELVLRQLLQRYTETYGGERDANRLASVSIEGVQIQRGVKYSFHIRKKRPSFIRYQLQRGDTRLSSIYNGQQGWLLMEKGDEVTTEELSGAKLAQLKREARFESPLYRHLEKPGIKIRLEGRKQIGAMDAYVLRVEEPESPPVRYFLHTENSHVLRIDRLDEEGVPVFQTLYRDYKIVDGYPFAHEVENRVNGDTISRTKIESISVNPGLLSFYFENPEN